ncbi:hypothetical protein G7059_02365 [Erysipelothrix sp. HDW6A]|uniref:DUF6709 family protein n=1 Tax=Erysipelothrix sp. HDW6A TaxID=2714928 RepID=UPI00140D384D|nr:DUF6709 family protein [Erysipelothrix sp. HDW6A]QIK56772.1 hypothetical protein G7059_02365 [Erysipelothrix sp. HDW6A]
MKDLIKYRKRSAWRVFAIFLVMGISGFFALGEVDNTIDSILGITAKKITTVEDFDKAMNNKDRVKIDVDFLGTTGFYYGSTNDIKYTISYTQFDNKLLLVRQYDDFDYNKEIEGVIESITIKNTGKLANSTVKRNIIQDYADSFGITYEEAEADFYPYIVDLAEFNSKTIYNIIIPGGILLVGLAIFLILGHKAVNDIDKYIGPEDLQKIDEESENPIMTAKQFILTPSFFIRKRGINIKKQIIKTEDIAYVYRKVTTHRTYGIKTGESQQIIIYANNLKRPVEIGTTERDFDDFVDNLYSLKLNIVFGYNANYLSAWKMSKNKSGFLTILKNDYNVSFEDENSEDEPETDLE